MIMAADYEDYNGQISVLEYFYLTDQLSMI